MISTIVKIAILAAVILIGLKIFSPETADKAVNKISDVTGVEKSTINDNLNKATTMTVQGAEKLKETTKESLK